MAHHPTMSANPAAGTFPEFLRARFGEKWVLAQRLTDRLRRAGHERSVARNQYAIAELEWEMLAYGAPVKSLEAAAPNMLAALRLALNHIPARAMVCSEGTHGDHVYVRDAVHAAIAKAEGRA